ncbi:MAG TPA: class E sortase [Thermoleophilaceae bacterium]|nr:class E sortase [Thermoleophilaceae bacterium]
MRRALRGLSIVLIATGVLLVLDAVLTVAWQEPVTALYGKVRQNELGGELKKLGRAPLSRAERSALRTLQSDPQRIAFLARSMRRHLGDGQALGRLRIPHIHANFVMVEGTDAGSLREGPGHYPDTPLPGMPGTVAIAGHRTTYLAPFNKLDKLRNGDEVRLEMPYAIVTYRVERTRIVKPTAVWVTKRVGYDRLVMTACHPKYSAAERIAVFARQVSAVENGVSARIR